MTTLAVVPGDDRRSGDEVCLLLVGKPPIHAGGEAKDQAKE